MAYKFQLGTFVASGSIKAESGFDAADQDIDNVGTINLDTIGADGNEIDIALADNQAAALEIKEGSNVYQKFVTTDGSEKVEFMKPIDFGNQAMTNVNIDSGAIELTAINIDGGTALGGASLAQADLFIIDDGAGGTNKSVTFSNLEDSIFGNISGDATVAAGGALTIAASAVEGSMLNNNIVSGLDDIGAAIAATDEMIISDAGTIKRTDVSRLGDFLAGDGLAVSSGVLAVGVDDTGIEISSDALRLKDNGVTLAKMAGLARGRIIIGDSSGDPSALALGSAGQIGVSDGDDLVYRSLSGDVTMAADGAVTIANDAVDADKLASNAVVNDSVASNAAISLTKINTNVDMGGNFTIGNQSDDTATFAGHLTVGGNLTVQGSTTTVDSTTINISSSFTFEGPADAHETILSCATPGADTTLNLPTLSAGTYFLPALADAATDASAAVTAAEFALLDGASTVGTTALAAGDGFLHNDNGTMKQTQISKLGDFFASDGLKAVSGQLELDVNSVGTAKTSLAQADLFALSDSAASDTTKKITFSNLEDAIFGNVSGDATIAAGGALTIAANAVEGSMLNNNVVSGLDDIGADIVGTDEILISDAGTIKRTDMSRLKTYIGSGTAAVALKDNSDTLAVGVNYFADHGGAESVTLPASSGLSVGESIKIKAGSDCSSTNTLTINRAGSQTIDGATSIVLESPFAAVELVYVAADTFRVF